ncbi:beta-1,3-galactosyltransferase brn-like isoform X2 [Brevipalpus obovatus]|uniref:beta-1,3-galactosyltransferase brn-like isoform X2 n=1 Tax=Brevipalpus obovatus TaxID=246614 RepID=UPI003D9F8C10
MIVIELGSMVADICNVIRSYGGKLFFRNRIRFLFLGCMIVVILHFFGIFIHPFEVSFDHFEYPLMLKNLPQIIEDHINVPKTSDQRREYDEEIFLTFVIKSALMHNASRLVIRNTWASEERFSDVKTRRVFIVGDCKKSLPYDEAIECDKMIRKESSQYKDIVQADFIDTYYNNTIKTMIGMRWVVDHCPRSQFLFFVDDDFYVSPKNLLKFIRDPLSGLEPSSKLSMSNKVPRLDDRLYGGYVFPNSSPMRHRTSKWYIPLSEYPYTKYPPYVSAGAYVLSLRALQEMYYASFYTKHFRFDDIYVGILANKISLNPLHNRYFYFWKKPYDPLEYSNVIASHGFDNPYELVKIYLDQKSRGNA